jgi:ribosomal protein L11 methyltransferase
MTDHHEPPVPGPPVVEIPPRFRVVAPSAVAPAGGITIVLRSGNAFGDGTHETTRLCLQAIGALAPRLAHEQRGEREWRLLDFGSGTGILSIGAAKLGAVALGIELDEHAIAVAEENARLSSVADRVSFARSLAGVTSTFDLVVANILRGVLVEVSADLVSRLASSGTLVLSGLVATDVPEVSGCYAQHLGGRRPEIYERGDWRALVWRAPRAGMRLGGPFA